MKGLRIPEHLHRPHSQPAYLIPRTECVEGDVDAQVRSGVLLGGDGKPRQLCQRKGEACLTPTEILREGD